MHSIVTTYLGQTFGNFTALSRKLIIGVDSDKSVSVSNIFYGIDQKGKVTVIYSKPSYKVFNYIEITRPSPMMRVPRTRGRPLTVSFATCCTEGRVSNALSALI